MSSLRLLVVEDDAARAEAIDCALTGAGMEVVVVHTDSDGAEALSLQQFDAVLISLRAEPGQAAQRLNAVAKRVTPPVQVIVWGTCDRADCDAVLSGDLLEGGLGLEIRRACQAAALDDDRNASSLVAFDGLAFREQMGDDTDLMREIINIYLEESAEQIRELRETLAADDFGRASRIAHSLKGSLGSLHAERARHWARALEAAAAAREPARCQQCLTSLECVIFELQPLLRELLEA